MLIELMLDPKEILEAKLPDGEVIKIHLKGADFRAEQYVGAAKKKDPETQRESDRLLSEISARLISVIVTKVEGISYKIKGTKEIIDFEITYDEFGYMDNRSYTIVMRTLNLCPEMIPIIQQFYKDSVEVLHVDEKKKKKKK